MWRLASVSLAVAASTVLLIACADRLLEPGVERAGMNASLSNGPTLAAPGGAVATGVSETEIDVGWVDNSSSETRFEVHRSTTGADGTFTLLASVGADVTQY